MRRMIPLAVTAAAVFAPFTPLQASGDYGCAPSWQVANRNYDQCGGRAMLSPGNDTRVNLFLLLRDRQAAGRTRLSYPTSYDDLSFGHNFFTWGSLRQAYYPEERDRGQTDEAGSRCNSLASGKESFIAAMQANRGLPTAERERLVEARGTIAASCTGNRTVVPPSLVAPDVKSAPGREYLSYLRAADGFYAEQWGLARSLFAGLRGAKDPWLAETAAYMLARAELNAAQHMALDEYGAFDLAKVDKAALGRASAGLADYLKRYGQGRYAASARGLQRRTLWLAGDAVGLAREYERLIGAMPGGSPGAADLVQEIDSKLIFVGEQPGKVVVDGPLLLATIDLMMMRESGEDGGLPVISAEQIAAQEPRFAGRADLFSFVVASHAYYVQKDMPKVLRLIADDAKKPSYPPLGFSRQVLRGMALAAVKDRNEAGFWRDLLGGANELYQRPLVELALAMNYERAARLADVFAPGSPIREATIREILLEKVAGPDLLRGAARNSQRPQHERDLALFTLLQKQLMFGDYGGFLRDLVLVPRGAKADGGLWVVREQEQIPVGMFRSGTFASDGYSCPALSATAAVLARNPRDAKARLCLGEFYRLNGFDDLGGREDGANRAELGGTPTLFPGRPTPRGDIYPAVIADAQAPAAEKAYALYRAINCYAPSGGNTCGNADVAESQRRAWFQQLKRDYPASSWAKQLRYYW